MRREIIPFFLLLALTLTTRSRGAGERLYGVHWWDYNRPTVGRGPDGGWTIETVLTNSDPWQQGWWFEPLYQQVNQTHNAEIVTRVDYTWNSGHTTVPAPSMMSATDWGNKILSDIIGPLGPYAHRWIIGNEPNLFGEGDGWPSNQVTPAGYAQIYNTVRQVIKAQRPQDEVLFAPVSPGGVVAGVRWKDGNEWLGEAIDATLALPGGAIDGFAIHGYGGGATASESVANFHSDYASQLNVIDSRSQKQAPVYMTEWNRWTSTTGNQATDEQISADFLRQSLADVDVWNRTPGNHNIVSLAWFIYDNVPGWKNYSIEWWSTHGNPEGHPGDLWTAMAASSNLLAGMRGTRSIADYNADSLVNASDFEAWRAAFGRASFPFADGNRSSIVDAGDYVLWRKTAAPSAGAELIPVPETPALYLLLWIVVTLTRIRNLFSKYRGAPCGPGLFELTISLMTTFANFTLKPTMRTVLTLCSLLFAIQPALAADEDDNHSATMLVLGKVWTADPRRPFVEAVAVEGEKIIAVGPRGELERHRGAKTQVIDAGSGMVVPGLIDSHIHLIDGGLQLASVQLRDAKTRDEFVRRIGDFAKKKKKGEWITGGDWDHTLWGGELPSRDWIDAVTPANPVWLNRLDGHMSLANSAAMRAAKVADDVKDVPGGEIVRDKAGRPAGVFKDNALGLIERAVPDPSMQQRLDATVAAMNYLAARGVTAVHHLGTWPQVEIFRVAERRGLLKTRIYACTPLGDWQRMAKEVKERGRGNDWLRIGGLKGYVDGSLGSHTAAFLEPYSDAPGDGGLLVNTKEDLENWTQGADKAGLQVLVHAIGDRAIRMQLDIFDRVSKANGPRDRRFRIEHAQHIAPADLSRFAKHGVIPSMQPYHAIDDGRWAEKSIGAKRCETTYAFRSLLDTGARLAFGSDWFVAPPTPMEGIFAAVTRRTIDGKNPDGWVPGQKINVEEALRAYTIDAAYAGFSEKSLGSIEPGKLADMVVLDRNLFETPPNELNTVPIRQTIVGGKIVYRRPN